MVKCSFQCSVTVINIGISNSLAMPTVREYFHVLREKWTAKNSSRCQHLYEYMIRSRGVTEMEEGRKSEIQNRIYSFITRVFQRWEKSRRTMQLFLKNNAEWLDSGIDFVKGNVEPEQVLVENLQPSTSGMGRPSKMFETLSERSKRRRTSELVDTNTTNELVFATSTSLRANKQGDAAQLVDEVIQGSPRRAKNIRQAWNIHRSGKNSMRPYSADEALNLIIEAKLTKHQYLAIRSGANAHNASNLYPSYEEIILAKKRCYPHDDCIEISDNCAEITLQALLDHTVHRTLQSQEPVLKTLDPGQRNSMVLITKWGCDGSSGHSMYKQRTNKEFDDSSLFFISLVPLQLYTHDNESRKMVVWQNPRPSSTRYCRPIKIQFVKETTSHILSATELIKSEVKHLLPTKSVSGKHFSVNHDLRMTMIDGKVCNALTNTVCTQNCNVCGAKPREMNDINSVIQRSISSTACQLGISPLHTRIRAFECLLHIAYKLDIKKWKVHGENEKKSVSERKAKIQTAFREAIGLVVDRPKQGSGTSNDGNTARRFFDNPGLSASITGLDKKLIHRLSIILRAISSPYEINIPNFQEYSFRTAKEFVSLYPWYFMPPSLHKVLIHGAAIIKAAPLAIGMFSEEAQESRNKDCKTFRELYTRKTSRADSNTDLLHLLLISSDPLITSLRGTPKKRTGNIPGEVLSLLSSPNINSISLHMETDESSDEV